jgi:DNA-binding beta-propeller fold protein YncE
MSDVGAFPLGVAIAPGGDHAVLLLSGFREQGVEIVETRTGASVQRLLQPSAFLGVAFSPDGDTLCASGGNEDAIYRYTFRGGRAALAGTVPLGSKEKGKFYPAGIAFSPDGRFLYVAENLGDSLAVVDTASWTLSGRLLSGRYPYAIAVAPDGTVYVSAWGGDSVWSYRPDATGALVPGPRLFAGRHPSAMTLDAAGTRLFVASGSTDSVMVLDPRSGRPLTTLLDPPPAGPAEGATPNALALSADGARLFVAEADANAVAVFDLSAATAGVATAKGDDRLAGRVPVGWYPTAVAVARDAILVANGKGRGTGANPDGPGPGRPRTCNDAVPCRGPDPSYTLGQVAGTVLRVPLSRTSGDPLAALSARVARANGWDHPRSRQASYPQIDHVIYVIKENRTYDQVLGDLPSGDGDTSLVYFPRAVSPNHHALADRFGLYDRFFVNAEVSPDGHNWSMAAYTTDYLQKTVPSNYSRPKRGRTYDYEGENRGRIPAGTADDDDVAEPARGYLWNLAQRRGITFRNFGEFVYREGEARGATPGYRGIKPFLAAHTCADYPGWDLTIPDQRRADAWIRELGGWVRAGEMPRLQVLRLPNDHTSGAKPGAPTPRAAMADNDLALGRIVEALSRSPFWTRTVVLVVEDDAQNGPDHVDSHRSLLFVVSPWSRKGTVRRFVNTTDVLATIEELLDLDALSQFDHHGRPLRDVWASAPDTSPYQAIVPSVALDEKNPEKGPGTEASRGLDLEAEDRADETALNRILWEAIKGPAAVYPTPVRMSLAEVKGR